MPGIEHKVFDTSGLTPDEAFRAYAQAAQIIHDVSAPEADFHVRFVTWRLHDMIAYDTIQSGQTHDRGIERIARDERNLLMFNLIRSGRWTIEEGERTGVAGPGEVLVMDTAQPYRLSSTQTQLITVAVRRETALAEGLPVRQLHCRILGTEASALLGAHLVSLVRLLPRLTAASLPAITHATLDLLSAAIAAQPELTGATRRSAVNGQWERVRQLIDARIGDPGLDAESLGAEIGVSRAALYRLFETGGGVGRYLLARRLSRIRQALLNRADARALNEIATAFGFTSEAVMNRAFRKRYGQDAVALRREVSEREGGLGGFVGWLPELG